MSLLSSKRKRTKLLDILLKTNWSKESQQAAKLLKLHKILLVCDANFLDEKTGQSPLSLAIGSAQIIATQSNNSPTSLSTIATTIVNQTSGQYHHNSNSNHYQATTVSGGGISCPQSASLFDLQCQVTPTGPSQLQQTNINELSQSRAPLIERLILLLVKCGAHIEFCNSDGQTPLHIAAMKSNFWALKTLLDLGAPTDYLDINGLTPLYYSILYKANLKVTQLLLRHNRNSSNDAKFVPTNAQHNQQQQANCNQQQLQSTVGIVDQHGWQEVHQACKLGLDAHLEKLLYYGCDINAKISGSGNTPLHVAAINDQLNCAKVLLLRGADKTITNNSHQTAHQVAVISNNMDLAEFIAEHNESKVVPFRERPVNFGGRDMPIAAPIAMAPFQMSIRSNSTTRSSIASSHSSASIAGQQRAIVQPQHQMAHMNPLVLDVAQMNTSGASSTALSNGSANSSQPQSLLSIRGHHHFYHPHHNHRPNSNDNHQLNVHVNNISPCLSQRSCATSNTTSSSGVCCDNDGNNSGEELNQQQQQAVMKLNNLLSQQSNITLIAINSNGANATIASNSNGNSSVSNGVPTLGAPNDGEGDAEDDDEDDLRSSESSSNGLYSLMSEERPLFAGTIVEATGEYHSGDPSHLHLRRGDLIEVLECARELLQGGELPRLANKPMLFGQRQSDSLSGLFPSFCVRRAKHRQKTRQRSAMTDITNSTAPLSSKPEVSQQREALQSITNEQQASSQNIRGQNLPESRSMAAIDKQQMSNQTGNGDTNAFKMRFLELKVTLTKTNEGFGFVLRGAKVDPATLAANHVGSRPDKIVIDERLMAANNLISLQYLDEIEIGSVAHRAGLKRGDFLVAVNQQDVRLSSHEQVVHMIRQSGDQVHLTIASPVQQKDPVSNLHQASYSSKTLGRVKPEPPKRDPSTTLTRNQAQRVKSMLVQPLQYHHQTFDANKPLPLAPSGNPSPMSPTGSLNMMGRSVSTNLSHFNSAQSLSSSTIDAQSISSVFNESAEQHQNQSGQQQQATPTHSSSSTTTLTTVATMKPKAPPKPSRNQLDQTVYQPAVITTAKRASQAQLSPIAPKDTPTQTNSVVPQVPGQPIPPPPPPPPLPDFSACTPKAANQRLSQRRESAPSVNISATLDQTNLLKKRESLANIGQPNPSNAPVPAQFGAVAAACAAAANSRMQRQQQKQQELQQHPQQHQDQPHQQPQQKPEMQQQELPPQQQLQHQQQQQQESQTLQVSQQPQMDQQVMEKPILKAKDQDVGEIDKEDKGNPVNAPVHGSEEAKLMHPAAVVNSSTKQLSRQQMSATLGRKSSAQIIQQPKQHSQTLKINNKPKRPGIPNYDDLPPPLLDGPTERTAVEHSQPQLQQQANMMPLHHQHHSHHHHHNHHVERQSIRQPEMVNMATTRQEFVQQQTLTLHQQQIIQQQLRQQHLLQHQRQQQQRQLNLQQQMQLQQQQQLCLASRHGQEQQLAQRYSSNPGASVNTAGNYRQYEHMIHQQAAQQQQNIQRVVATNANAHSHHHHHHHHNHHSHHSHHPHHHHNHEQTMTTAVQLQHQQQQQFHQNHHQHPSLALQAALAQAVFAGASDPSAPTHPDARYAHFATP